MTPNKHMVEATQAAYEKGLKRAAYDKGLEEGRAQMLQLYGHPDANRHDRNHYDWFMPDNPTAAVDVYLDDFEAKMQRALTDPFVHDMAQSVLPLIAAYRELRDNERQP